jgi:hypothetical protein
MKWRRPRPSICTVEAVEMGDREPHHRWSSSRMCHMSHGCARVKGWGTQPGWAAVVCWAVCVGDHLFTPMIISFSSVESEGPPLIMSDRLSGLCASSCAAVSLKPSRLFRLYLFRRLFLYLFHLLLSRLWNRNRHQASWCWSPRLRQ